MGGRGCKLGRAVFVGDAGMDSSAKRRELAKGLGHYILAMPIGKLKEVQEEVLARPGRFHRVTDRLKVKEVVVGERASGGAATSSVATRRRPRGSGTTGRPCWRSSARNWRGWSPTPRATPSGPASWWPRPATGGA